VSGAAVVLFLSSCATAVLHALIPDHWLPFVLLSRSQGWSDRRLAVMVALAGLLHVLVSTAVAILAIAAGTTSVRGLAERTGHSLQFLAGALLVLFGAAYGLLTYGREARAHGRAATEPDGHVHAHGHLLERCFHGALGAGALVAVIGISPCALMVPILFAASAQGVLPAVSAALGFAASTIVTMVGVAWSATRGMRRLDLPFFTHYGDLASGLLIAAIGAVIMTLER
jgi:nickel/cobalt exporter